MTTTRVGNLNVTVELNTPNICGGLHGYDVVVSTENGTVLLIHENTYNDTEEEAMKGMWYENAIKFAQRYSILMDAFDQATKDQDSERMEILAKWMGEMVGRKMA